MEKLCVVVRRDLPAGDQAVQAIHAAVQFTQDHPEAATRWFIKSNYLALLSVADEAALHDLVQRVEEKGLKYSFFVEPDLGNTWTAVALEPAARRICSSLPLALAEA